LLNDQILTDRTLKSVNAQQAFQTFLCMKRAKLPHKNNNRLKMNKLQQSRNLSKDPYNRQMSHIDTVPPLIFATHWHSVSKMDVHSIKSLASPV